MSWPCKQLTVKTQDAELRAWSNDLATKTLQTGILLNTIYFGTTCCDDEQEHLRADDEAPAGLQDADEEAGAGTDHHQKYMFLLSPTMLGNSQKIFLVVVEF